MKNKIIVDIDTGRTGSPVMIEKLSDDVMKVAESEEDIKNMVKDDIITLCFGLTTLIDLMKDKKYFSEEELKKLCYTYLRDCF